MRFTDRLQKELSEILKVSKNLRVQQNVSFRVFDKATGKLVAEHEGHNTATNSLITGIAHYLVGDGIYNQAYDMLSRYIPFYISLGTMGLLNQEQDSEGLPAGVGVLLKKDDDETTDQLLDDYYATLDQIDRITNGYYAHNPLNQKDFIHDKFGNKIYIPGVKYLEDLLKKEQLCPYCLEQDIEFLMPDRCVNCMFPEKRAAIDRILNGYYLVYDDGEPYDPTKTYEEIINPTTNMPIWVKGLTELRYDLQEAEAKLAALFEELEGARFDKYLDQTPAFGSDGSGVVGSEDLNFREYHGLGPVFANRLDKSKTIDCELISGTFPRELIAYREIVPETKSELKHTVDIVFSAMISTGALKQFREPGKDYIFITEAGLWSSKEWSDSGENGLLAGYRLAPPNRENWYMRPSSVPPEMVTPDKSAEEIARENRKILKQNILKVGINQIVQVVWKIQIGSLDQFDGMRDAFTQKQYVKTEDMLFGHIPSKIPYKEGE